ncbi:ABC transporter permease [Streptomyces phytophilus]|uniref:ABC transporter permease n=1 Tax=Streptomyces phytophilus TaxID=722715 RepID=UPI0015F099AF|nr:ABC transporter permease [Streptomyces phytophilus]
MHVLAADTALVFGRYARQTLRSRFQMLFGILMPLLYLVFFGPLLRDLPLAADASSWQVLVPGLLMMLGLFSASFAGFGIIVEKNLGVLDRMRATPVSRLALLLGRVLRDALLLLFQAVLLVVAAVAMGLRAPLPGVLIGLVFVALLSTAMASLSYAFALRVRTPQEFGPVVNAVTLPSMLLSGLMLPMALAPGWLDALSRAVPYRYVVDAVRAAFTGEYAGTEMLWGALVAAAFAAGAVTLGTRVFRGAGA